MDREFKIKITTTTDSTGAQQAAGDLGKIGDATKEAGTHAEFFNLHGRETHRLIHEIGRVSPVAGLAVRSFLNPETLGIAAVVVGFEAIVKSIEEAKKASEEAAKASAELWLAQRNAVEEFSKAMDTAISKQDQLKGRFSEEKAVLDAIIQQQKTLFPDKFKGTAGEEEKLMLARNQFSALSQQQPHLADRLMTIAGVNSTGGVDTDKIAAMRETIKGGPEQEAKLQAAAKEAEKELREGMQKNGLTSMDQARDFYRNTGLLYDYDKATGNFQNFEKAKSTVADYDETLKAQKENSDAMRKLAQEISTMTQVLGIHRQTETFQNAPDTIAHGTPQQVQQLVAALGFSERSSRAILDAMFAHVANRAKAEQAILARLATVESQLGNQRTH